MDEDLETRIAAFWASADDERGAEARAALEELLSAHPPEALPHREGRVLYERASLEDFLGEEAAAAPLYEAAIAAGLDAEHGARARIQLASTLRNLGRAEEAVALLEVQSADDPHAAPGRAFLALALHDAGRPEEALAVALEALADMLPRYARSVRYYARELRVRARAEHPDSLGESTG